jgi:hypothetical protein
MKNAICSIILFGSVTAGWAQHSAPQWECLVGTPNWNIGGNNFSGMTSGYPGLLDARIGTCDLYDFVLMSNSSPRAWIKTDGTISFGADIPSNSGGPEYIFNQGALRLLGNNTFGGPQLLFDNAAPGVSPYGDWGIEYTGGTGAPNSGLNFWKPFGSANSANNILFLADNGNIGINTDSPIAKLDIKGNGLTGGIRYNSTILAAPAFEIVTGTGSVVSRFKTYSDGKTFIGQFASPGNDWALNGSILTVGQSVAANPALNVVSNTSITAPLDLFTVYGSGRTEIKIASASEKAFAIYNNANPSTPIDNFNIRNDGRIEIAGPTINNTIGVNPYQVAPFLVNMNSAFKSGIKIRTASNGAFDPQIMVGNTTDNKDEFFVFGDGTTYIGDEWNGSGVSQAIYASAFPRLAAQTTKVSGQSNRAAFLASVKGQVVNETVGQSGYCAAFHSDNVDTKAITVMCTDPSLNLQANAWYEGFKVYANGRTYIGGQKVGGVHAGAMLQVAGEITCKSLYVLKPAVWQDRVFSDEYRQMELSDVEEFIRQNKHLPGVQSESEVMENGYDVNEVDAALLEKIENLYLYIIRQQKDIEELKKKLNEK